MISSFLVLSTSICIMFVYKLLCFVVSAMVTTLAVAFPRGCEVSGFGFDGPYVVFNDAEKQSFFLIQNHSNINIELQRLNTHEAFMSPKLQSKLNVNKWSAIATDISDLYFECFKHSSDGEPQRISCRDVLTICQYPRVKFALSNMGSYWVSTNKPQEQVIQESIKKGILLRW